MPLGMKVGLGPYYIVLDVCVCVCVHMCVWLAQEGDVSQVLLRAVHQPQKWSNRGIFVHLIGVGKVR